MRKPRRTTGRPKCRRTGRRIAGAAPPRRSRPRGRLSQDSFRALFETLANGVVYQDAQGRILDANPSAEKILGLSVARLRGRTSHDPRWQAIHEDGTAFAGDEHPSMVALRTGKPVRGVVMGILRPGENRHRWLAVDAVPQFRPRARRPFQVYATFTDITARRDAQTERDRLFDLSIDMLCIAGFDGRFQQTNPAWERALGWTREELCSRPWIEFVHPDDRPATVEAGRRLFRGQALMAFENRYRCRDGSYRWLSWNALPLSQEERIFAVARDITEQKRAGELLRGMSRRHEAILAAVPDIIAEVDADRVYTWMNAAGLAFFGEDAIGREASFFFEGEQSTYELVGPLFGGAEDVIYVESWQRRRDGEKRLLAWWCRVLKDEEGRVTGTLSTARDVTDQRRADETHRRHEAELASLARAAPVGIGLVADRVLLKVNERICEMTGYTADELVGRSSRVLYPSDADFEWVGREKYRQIREQGTGTVETRWQRKDGAIRDVLLSSTPIDPADLSAGVTFTALDITERKRAEEARFEYLARFSGFAEASQYGMGMADLDGRITYVNSTLCRLLGEKSAEECMGKHFPTTYYAPETARRLQEEVMPALMRDGHWHGELELLTADGRRVPTDENYFVIRDEQGRPRQLADILTDITERKRAEEALRRSEAMLRSIFSAAPVGIGVVNRRIVQAVNDAFEEICGYTAAELIGQETRKLYPDQDEYERVGRELYADLWRLGTRMTDARLRRKDGTVIHTILRAAPLHADDPSAGIAFSVMDITDRKRAEEALRFTQFGVDHMGDAAFWMESDGRIVYVNEAACRTLGYSREELLGRRVPDIDPDFGADKWREHWERLREAGSLSFESRHRTKDGRVFPVEISANHVDFGGKEYHCSFARDITLRREIEAERERLLRELEAKNQELESLLYAASHDLRSPLVNIQGFARQLDDVCRQIASVLGEPAPSSALPDRLVSAFRELVPTALHFIRSSGEKMDALLNGLLKVCRTGRVVLRRERLDMNFLLQEVTASLRFQIQEVSPQLVIEPLPACVGDEGQINQVFTNLIDNALKYRTPSRPLRIRVFGYVEGQHAVYGVEDTGCGIEPAHMAKIWDLFHRLEPQGTVSGEGIGLTLVRRIVERHNGRAWVESEPNKGSRFFVSFPAVPQETVNEREPDGLPLHPA